MLLVLWCMIMVLSSDCLDAAVIPFRDSIEVVFTPEDIKKSTDYVLWKVPTMKNNLKTTVKQKLLNKLLDKDLQDFEINPFIEQAAPKKNIESKEEHVLGSSDMNNQEPMDKKDNTVGNSVKKLELEIQNPKGVVNSIIKNPSKSERKNAKMKIIDDSSFNDPQIDAPQIDAENEISTQQETEHVGYSSPTKIKNRKHAF